MKYIKSLKSVIAVLLIVICTEASYAASDVQEKRIYLVDVSGSMTGKGSVCSADILGKVKDSLVSTINWAPAKTQFVVIPFTDEVYPMIVGNTDNIVSVLGEISELWERDGNTDLVKAWKTGLLQLDSSKVNYLFLITDGLHNRGATKEQLVDILSEWPRVSEEYDAEAYFVVVDSSYRSSYICSIFDSCDRMHIVESMNVFRERYPVDNQSCDVAIDSPDEERDICWLWWLVILIVILLAVFFIVQYRSMIVAMFSRIKFASVRPSISDNKEQTYEDVVDDNGGKEDDEVDDDWRIRVKAKTNWNDEIIYALRSEAEAKIYIKAGLKQSVIGGRLALIQPKINPGMRTPKWYLKEHPEWKDWTNADLAGEGYAPFASPKIPGTEKGTDQYELHHVGQKPDSPLAELTYSQHHDDGNFAILHYFEDSLIEREIFKKERSRYWQERYKSSWAKNDSVK